MVLQSCHVDHYAVQAAKATDYREFYEKDIRYRKLVGYPPAGALARIEFRHKDAEKVNSIAAEAARILRAAGVTGVRILGPAEPPLAAWRVCTGATSC